MKVHTLKKDKKQDSVVDASLKIQTWGARNDYPQTIDEIIFGSVTGKSCLDVFTNFIYGKGFKDEAVYSLIVNRKRQTLNDILKLIAKDYAENGGFALHFNYNLNGNIVEIQFVKVETVRLSAPNKEGYFNTVKTYSDWGKRGVEARTKTISAKDVKEYNLFNPYQVEAEIAAVGIDSYMGQILFYSNNGDKVYPTPIFAPALTDMSTEQGLSNISYRNARKNFQPAGMLVEITSKSQDEENENDTAAQLGEIQGDENGGKIIHCEVETKEEIPQFIDLGTKNYDKEFTVTNDSVEARIGKAFKQLPILRSVDVAGNIGADLIVNAYHFYNSITESDRNIIERIFEQVLALWITPITASTEIEPLTFKIEKSIYERLNDKQLEIFMTILSSVDDNKVAKLKKIFGLTDEELEGLI